MTKSPPRSPSSDSGKSSQSAASSPVGYGNTMRTGSLQELAMHPTVKPVALVIDAINDRSRQGTRSTRPIAIGLEPTLRHHGDRAIGKAISGKKAAHVESAASSQESESERKVAIHSEIATGGATNAG
jgi:hypothetical protein